MKLRAYLWGLISCVPLILFAGCAQLAPDESAGATKALESTESAFPEVKDLAEVARYLQSNAGTLLVLDIDDTLLTSPVFFGSDRWYTWQGKLSQGDPRKLACLYEVGAMNYESGYQVPTQPNAAEIINALSGDKLILTARGPGNRGATIRELLKAGYTLPATLSSNADGIIYGYRSSPTAKPVTVSYNDGVFMVAGRDKGLVLLDLLGRLHRTYQRVVLVDDSETNLSKMAAALKNAGIDYQGLWYTHIDKRSPPTAAEEQAGVDGWEAWKTLLRKNFPGRLERIQEPCAY